MHKLVDKSTTFLYNVHIFYLKFKLINNIYAIINE